MRAGALEVANEQLPETVARIRSGKEPDEIAPIPVHSHEELGQLARAVDDMHKQAVNLATGEAHLRSQVGAMFVTLSRRNTTLVNQQLALIESLEQDEEDPQRLEQLFSLDHLATRMRRTAESLVILGGAPGRTAGFEELSVSDVIHAAVSEVQDYQRVRIDAAPDRMIVGRAASDVVHLMAELIDNALSYSPPGSPVTIQAAEEDGKVEIEIIDNGLGMAGDALAQANDSLKSGGEVTIDTARRMGLFVVSRLAEEHGLKVKLRRNTNGGGIIASILLPAAVLVSDGPVEHVSVLDAPEKLEEPVAPVVEEEPEEEYDPYLERIEEAIAAVTGLPRRRPGLAARPGPGGPGRLRSACSTRRQPRAARRASSRPSCRAWRTTTVRVGGRRAGAGRRLADETEDLDVPVSLTTSASPRSSRPTSAVSGRSRSPRPSGARPPTSVERPSRPSGRAGRAARRAPASSRAAEPAGRGSTPVDESSPRTSSRTKPSPWRSRWHRPTRPSTWGSTTTTSPSP